MFLSGLFFISEGAWASTALSLLARVTKTKTGLEQEADGAESASPCSHGESRAEDTW